MPEVLAHEICGVQPMTGPTEYEDYYSSSAAKEVFEKRDREIPNYIATEIFIQADTVNRNNTKIYKYWRDDPWYD